MKRFLLLLIISLFLCEDILSSSAKADIRTEADLSFWWVIHEDMENGMLQAGSRDEADEVASGFSINRARVSFFYLVPEHQILSKVKVRMEDRFVLYDVYISYQPSSLFHIYLGQMKIPTTYEVLTADAGLDFITRTTFSRNIVNYSLAKTPYISALQGLNCYNRDMGVGIKGSWSAGQDHDVFRYFVMVGNGLGANLDIGGKESKGFITSNEFGEYFYGVRAEISPWERMNLGGHYNRNVHHDMLYKDETTVYDLDRTSWSADLRLSLPFDFSLTGLFGEGVVDDDYFRDGNKNYEYSGWEARVIKGFLENKLELGVRVDSYEYEYNESGDITFEDHWTYGINYTPFPEFRLQLNYITKDTVSDYDDDLDDDIIFLNVQFLMNAGLNTE